MANRPQDTIVLNSMDDVFKFAETLRRETADTSIVSEKEIMKRMRNHYGYYAHRALKIQPKDGPQMQFMFNKGQWYLYALAEYQLKTLGRVRIIIVKGRQQGISTWTEGRGYWKASQNTGVRAIVLAHESSASNNLFEMFKTYHSGVPDYLQPSVGKDNEKIFAFPKLESSVKVFTSGNKGVGRSQTCNFFHGSEMAFWEHAYEHSAGIMQTISKGADSEVYLESTAYGNTGLFAETWELGHYPWEQRKPHGNDYIRCFIPWYWEPTYREPAPEYFAPTSEEIEYADLHELDYDQLQWRRTKIAECGGDSSRFARDYPATPEEAFNSSLDDILIQPNDVLRARKNFRECLDDYLNPSMPAIIGCDVAREGDDATCIVVRQGRVILHYEQHYKKNGAYIAKRIIVLAAKYRASRTFVDNTGGFGGSVLDFLTDVHGYMDATGIHFAEAANDTDQYYNIRSEMWWNLKLWIEDGAAIPDSAEMQKDFCTPKYRHNPADDKLRLEAKSDIKKRGIKSPDIGDACALTFAYPVTRASMQQSYEPEEA